MMALAGGGSLAGMPAVAASDRTIPVEIMDHRDNDTFKYEAGDSCSFSTGSLDILWADLQLVVRDETGTIIAVQTVDSGTVSLGGAPDSAFCELEVEVRVPEAKFYTLYVAGTREVRVMTWPASAFPIETTFPIVIDPDVVAP
jgi:hypothetical protein